MDEEETEFGPIMLLPNEIIGIILQNLRCRDIVNFGATCKQYNELVNTNQYIWKEKFREILPSTISKIVAKHGNGVWLDEIKRFYAIKKKVYEELMAMSPKFYWRTSELTIADVKSFFDVALSCNISYHYVIVILQEIISLGIKYADRNYNEKPFTMTDVYYAKIVVRFLYQTFLTLKWVESHERDELPPDTVVNFFIQWVDPVKMHLEDVAQFAIQGLVIKVEAMFPFDPAHSECVGVWEKLEKGLIDQKQVLEAVSDVIYRQEHMAIMTGSNLEGLDIALAIENRCSSLITIAVIYQAVARYCGVHCELIAFPNHLFLEWRDPNRPAYSFKIDLETGDLVPQGRCPFAPSAFRKEYKYNPDGFLQYVVSAYLMTMGAIKNWSTQNALFLLDFLSNNINEDNPYKDFLHYLDGLLASQLIAPGPLALEYIHNDYMRFLRIASNISSAPPAHFARETEVKRHDPNVTFAVGMLAYHKKYDYLCVVRGWDLKCTNDWRRRVEFKNLEYGSRQPFYSVIAVDQSERYVPQENLIHVDRPTRLFHLEDIIAKEFSHFDGYSYVPNDEKIKEYPDDEIIRNMYRSRAEQRAEELREAL